MKLLVAFITISYVRASDLAVAWGELTCTNDGCTQEALFDVDLTDIVDISCGGHACVVRKDDTDKTAFARGRREFGGDIRCTDTDASTCNPLPGGIELTNVVDISCGEYACVARKTDGTAFAWGHPERGGDASGIELTNVVDISCGFGACVARKNDGTAFAWGDPNRGGNVPDDVVLTDVVDISCGDYACVARKFNGDAVAWGHPDRGGDASGIDLTNVVDISCGKGACVARKNDGTAVVWGVPTWGGDASGIELTNVVDISCGGYACVARKTNGDAFAWGNPIKGGNVPDDVELTNVVDISCGKNACVARKTDGTAFAWGRPDRGGDASGIDLTNVVDISCGGNTCVALRQFCPCDNGQGGYLKTECPDWEPHCASCNGGHYLSGIECKACAAGKHQSSNTFTGNECTTCGSNLKSGDGAAVCSRCDDDKVTVDHLECVLLEGALAEAGAGVECPECPECPDPTCPTTSEVLAAATAPELIAAYTVHQNSDC